MKAKNFMPVLCSAVVVLMVGCASSRKLDVSRAKAVKKVAIVSVEIQLQQPKDALGFARVSEIKSGRAADGPEFQGMAKNVTATLTKRLEAKTGWRVLSYDTVTANSAFSKKVMQKMDGLHAVSMTTANTDIVVPKGLLGNAPFRLMSLAERAQLAKDLGADAYAEVVIYNTIEQGYSFGNLTGDAAFAHQGRANLIVYGLDSEEPIWQVQNIDGNVSSESTALPGKLSKLEKLAKTGEEAAQSSVEKLMEDFSKP